MPDLRASKLIGVLRNGWSATVDDYAIAGAWTLAGDVFVVIDAAGSVFGFDGRSGAVRWVHRGVHSGGSLSVAVHPNQATVATAGQDGRIFTWNASNGEKCQTIDLGKGWVENLAWSSNGQFLAASMGRRVYVNHENGDEVWRSDDHLSTVSALAWSQSNELAVACYGEVSFYGASTGELTQKLAWKGSLVSLVLSPDGDIVACGSQDNSVHFWRRSTAQDSTMSGYPGKPSTLAFDDSGTLLATGGGETVTVWSFQGDGPEGTRPGALNLHNMSVTALTFAPGTKRLASGARDGSVVVWNVRADGEGNPEGAAQLAERIEGLAWRPDGRGLVAFDAKGVITAWRVSKA